MSKIAIVLNPERERSQVRRQRRHVFSNETNLFLLRLLQKDTGLPHSLGNVPVGARDLQLELAATIRQRMLPWFWSVLLHLALLVLLASSLYRVNRLAPIDMIGGFANIPGLGDGHVVGPPGTGDGTGIGNSGAVGDGSVPGLADDNQNNSLGNNPDNVVPRSILHTSPGLEFGFGIGGGGGGNGEGDGWGGGGTGGQPDPAVIAGLQWLVSVQEPNGTWLFSSKRFPQSATQRREDTLAATAMALLAFQGIGVTPSSNHPALAKFAQPVRRGWEWLREQQNADGSFFAERSGIGTHRFYTHAFCTIALCELLLMTGNETLREPAQRAIDYCVQHQSMRGGGWRYLPDRFSDQSDVSVTGWIILALKSGQAAGLAVPPESYHRASQFLDSMMLASNHYMYREEEPTPRIVMTAEASFCRVLLGWRRDNPRLAAGVHLILDSPPEQGTRDAYYWFFATQTLYHYGGDEWQTWSSTMREVLVQQQEKLGTDAGSWSPNYDAWAQYGRLYTTCMSLYILEVNYRHLRIFP